MEERYPGGKAKKLGFGLMRLPQKDGATDLDEVKAMVDLFMQAFLPDLRSALGSYIPLIVVNCIIFARAESFAAKNPPLLSLADGLGMGIGFTISITLLAAIRELFGAGTIFGAQVMPESYQPMGIMTQVPGGFITLGLMMILANAARKSFQKRRAARKEAAA